MWTSGETHRIPPTSRIPGTLSPIIPATTTSTSLRSTASSLPAPIRITLSSEPLVRSPESDNQVGQSGANSPAHQGDRHALGDDHPRDQPAPVPESLEHGVLADPFLRAHPGRVSG